MNRGIPTEETLAEMRQADPPVSYLVGVPKGRRAGSSAISSAGPGGSLARASRSSCCRGTANSMCSPRASTGSPRSAACYGGN